MDFGLQRLGLSKKDFGEAILDAAKERQKKQITEEVVDTVVLLNQTIDQQKNTIEALERGIKRNELRLRAIERGEISLQVAHQMGIPNRTYIKYDDEELNRND